MSTRRATGRSPLNQERPSPRRCKEGLESAGRLMISAHRHQCMGRHMEGARKGLGLLPHRQLSEHGALNPAATGSGAASPQKGSQQRILQMMQEQAAVKKQEEEKARRRQKRAAAVGVQAYGQRERCEVARPSAVRRPKRSGVDRAALEEKRVTLADVDTYTPPGRRMMPCGKETASQCCGSTHPLRSGYSARPPLRSAAHPCLGSIVITLLRWHGAVSLTFGEANKQHVGRNYFPEPEPYLSVGVSVPSPSTSLSPPSQVRLQRTERRRQLLASCGSCRRRLSRHQCSILSR